ncbi:hypothetical protein DFH09DRAFT_1105921 [Mycena vulgaris]|nr:hypothetical protein DFH09DRAFT_1105921 [Mycena vulgaris]
MPTATQVMSAAEDKAFKQGKYHAPKLEDLIVLTGPSADIMRAPDAPRTKELQRWINSYISPQESTTTPKISYYERKRAELVERKSRVTALMQLRARALKASAKSWPRYRDIATREHNAHAAKEAQRRERIRLVAEAETAREMRSAADARVATLMALRGSIPRRLVPICMTRGSMPPDVCREIALLSTPETVASLSLLGRVCAVLLRPLLYRQITVGDRANRLVQTLATHDCTAALVESLVFEDSVCAYIHDSDWDRVLAALVNLRHLTITHHVPLSWNSLPSIRFRLRSFTSVGRVVGAWAQFLHLQPELQEIILHSDLLAAPPGRTALPVLRRLSARPDELSKFALMHPLESMVFWVGAPWEGRGLKTRDLVRFGDSTCQLRMLRVNSSQLYILFRNVPQMLITLEHLVIDEDTAWSRNSTAAAQEQRLLMRAASVIDVIHAPILKSLTMLGTFHFCASDTCRTWRQWGAHGETIEDIPRTTHITQDWNLV